MPIDLHQHNRDEINALTPELRFNDIDPGGGGGGGNSVKKGVAKSHHWTKEGVFSNAIINIIRDSGTERHLEVVRPRAISFGHCYWGVGKDAVLCVMELWLRSRGAAPVSHRGPEVV